MGDESNQWYGKTFQMKRLKRLVWGRWIRKDKIKVYRVRAHSVKLKGQIKKMIKRKYFFTQDNINL